MCVGYIGMVDYDANSITVTYKSNILGKCMLTSGRCCLRTGEDLVARDPEDRRYNGSLRRHW